MGDKKQTIIDISGRAGNTECADCRNSSVEYASYNLGAFLCTTCVSVHRQMGTHISQTKHLRNDRWLDGAVLNFMAERGNLAVNAEYEKHMPECYRRPTEDDPAVLLEQFIRAKYERLEFVYPERQLAYCASHKSGHLFKRGRDNARFEIRRFELSEAQNTLAYYVKVGKEPKLVMQLQSLNVALVPLKINHPNGLQMTYVHDGSVRHIYVYHNDGQTLVDWYNAIRNAKLNNLLVAFPGSSVAELSAGLTRDFTREGWLSKIGPRAGDQYRRRWFTLDGRKLMYHDSLLDAVPKGVIPIGERESGYSVILNVPAGSKSQGFSFTLRTPERTYLLSALTDEERACWMEVLSALLDQPLTPQEKALAGCLRRKQATSRRGLSVSTADGLHQLTATDGHVTSAPGHVAARRRALPPPPLSRSLSRSTGNMFHW